MSGRKKTCSKKDSKRVEVIRVSPIKLEWSEWIPWDKLAADVRKGGVKIPDTSGVYEVKTKTGKKLLTIGKASNLRARIRQGLVKGSSPHSTGERIRNEEDVSRLVIRWAETDRPSTAEEALYREYRKKFNELPCYVRQKMGKEE